MRSINLSRAGLPLLLVATLSAGVVLGGTLPSLDNGPTASSTPTPTEPPTSPVGLPRADMAGRDLERLPRYPGSIRSEFDQTSDVRFRLTAVEYLADAPLDDVRTFYERVIEDHGWQRADIAFSGGEWTYVLVDGATEALIELEISAGLVEIDLHHSEPIQAPQTDATPPPTPAPPPPAPAPAPPEDDDDDDGGSADDDGGSDD